MWVVLSAQPVPATLPAHHNRSPLFIHTQPHAPHPTPQDAAASLRAATKWYPLHDLRLAIDAAEASEQAVDDAALAEAHARLTRLATDELVALIHRRQLEPLAAAVAELEAQGGGAVEAAVAEEARTLVAVLEKEPRGAEAAPAGTHPMDTLTQPAHIDAATALGTAIMQCAGKGQVAEQGFEYWGGDQQPWRNGLDKSPVTDTAVIASETQHKQAAEADDEATAGTPFMPRSCGAAACGSTSCSRSRSR